MPIQFEIHDNLTDQPSEILDELIDTPRLCMLLNTKQDLHDSQD